MLVNQHKIGLHVPWHSAVAFWSAMVAWPGVSGSTTSMLLASALPGLLFSSSLNLGCSMFLMCCVCTVVLFLPPTHPTSSVSCEHWLCLGMSWLGF